MPRIGEREGETVEFKREWTPRALDDVCAFANTRGGTVYLGIEDDAEIVGYDPDDRMIQTISGRITDQLAITPSIRREEHSELPVVAIEVDRAPAVVSLRGRYYRRVGSTNRQMTSDELADRLLERAGESWDALPASRAPDDVEQDTIARFRELAADRLPALRDEDTPALILDNLNLLREGSLTNAGVLLFGDAPGRMFPRASTKLGRFEGGELVESRIYEGNLFAQLDGVLRGLRDIVGSEYRFAEGGGGLEGVTRRQVDPYPVDALREAIVNALVHRDYTAAGEIQIKVRRDRLEVWNPGGLPEDLEVEDLKGPHPSLARNPLIARTFYHAGLVEEWGTGTTRMTQAFRDRNLPEPQFSEVAGGFKVALWRRLFTEDRLRELGLNERQIRAVEYARTKGSITNREHRTLTEVSQATAYRDLKGLVEAGVLTQMGEEGRNVEYVPAGPGSSDEEKEQGVAD